MEKSFCLVPILSFAGLFPGGIYIDLSVFIQSFIHSVIQYLGDASVVYPWVMALMDDVSTVFLFFHSLMLCSTLRMTDIWLVCRPMFRIGMSRTWIEFVVYAVMVYALSWENQNKKNHPREAKQLANNQLECCEIDIESLAATCKCSFLLMYYLQTRSLVLILHELLGIQ